MTARRTEPSKSLLQGMEYVNAASTDIRRLFERVKAQQQRTETQPRKLKKVRG